MEDQNPPIQGYPKTSSMEGASKATPPRQPLKPYGRSWKKSILIYLAIGVAILIGVYYFALSYNAPHAQNSSVYKSKEECESKTGKVCGFIMCDYVPPGKTFEETCGKNFKEGWQPTTDNLSSSPVPDPTADWKTYTNDKYSYSIKYPSDVKIDDSVDEAITLTRNTTPKTGFGGQGTCCGMTIYYRNYGGIDISGYELVKSTINSYTATRVKHAIPYEQDVWIDNPNKQNTFRISITTRGAVKPYDKEDFQIFNQILSTFKFTKATTKNNIQSTPTPVANPGMKVYATDYGFYFQYPERFILNNTSTKDTISFLEQQNDIKAQRVLVDIKSTNQSLQDFARDQVYYNSEDFPVVEEQQVIDGHQALALTKTFSMQEMCHSGNNEKMKRTSYLLVKGDGIIATFIVNDSCYTVASDWFSQIPPTIKFTK